MRGQSIFPRDVRSGEEHRADDPEARDHVLGKMEIWIFSLEFREDLFKFTPIHCSLASFLVRDLEVAYKLSGKFKVLNFVNSINFICLDKYDEDAAAPRRPANCEPLSSYLKIKVRRAVNY